MSGLFADQIAVECRDALEVMILQVVLGISAEGIGEKDLFLADVPELLHETFMQGLSAAHLIKGQCKQLIEVLIGKIILVQEAAVEGLPGNPGSVRDFPDCDVFQLLMAHAFLESFN